MSDKEIRKEILYAHSKEGRPCSEWHPLETHLRDTASTARQFAEPWGAGEWAYYAGLWHDLGKRSKAFQDMIHAADGVDAHCETQPRRVDHSTAGLIHAMASLPKDCGLPIALAIGGHHAGLPNVAESFKTRLSRRPLLEAAYANGGNAPWLKPSSAFPGLPFLAAGMPKEAQKIALEVWTRFLFSALVDADFLDTETFYEPSRVEKRKAKTSLKNLLTRLDEHLSKKATDADDTTVNRVRRDILAACQDAARQKTSVFSLTAPTGAGKTLSGMAFALRHAREHDLRRVIVVLPYTSIIEQSAHVYRDVFGSDAVVEHHSNLDPQNESHRNKLAAENWDAPIIVTTTVQFIGLPQTPQYRAFRGDS
jgi:CRISPR-associated endonuclease/helicase Cas3